MNLPRLVLRAALGKRLPVTAGDVRVPGLGAPVTVRRDKWGVPSIDAASDADAAFGLGFCQAQDRGGQLEVLLRAGRGTLAEWVGPAGLPTDRMSRRIGFRRSADAQLPAIAPHVRTALDGFVAGVNAGFAHGLSAKPHEFAVLGGTPSPWDAADVLALLQLQSFTLPSNWDVELARLRLVRSDGADAMRELDPLYPAGHPVTLGAADAAGRPSALLDRLAADLAAMLTFTPPGGGSNNWVIAGSRTASGKPLLASDPHLGPTAPPPWYVAHVRTPGWAASGALLPGTPAVSIGHNGFCAWGVTAGLTDNTDLFLETLGPDGTSVRGADGTFTPCRTVRETIRVKGKPDAVEDVLLTPRGPIVTPLLPGVREAVSLRAVWLDPLPFDGLLSAPKATSFETFRRPFAEWPCLPLNVLYADTTGTTGWQLVGQLPRRKSGNGTLPTPADAPNAGWHADHLPFDAMPHFTDPPRGYAATANNMPTQQSAVGSRQSAGVGTEDSSLPPAACLLPLFLGLDFCDGYRVAVITDELGKRTDWDVPGCLALQRNVRSKPWEEVRAVVLSVVTDTPAANDALALLRGWDGNVDADSPAAAVFELFVAEMCVRTAKAKAPNGWRVALGESPFGPIGHSMFTDRRVGHLVRLLLDQPAGWFPRPWPDEIADALAATAHRLRREAGPGPKFWGWGHLRRLRLDHPLFAKSRLLGPAFNLGPVPVAGDPNTVSQAGCNPNDPTAFTHNMANLRTVFDLSDLAASRFVLCGGQSGNPCSPHHADLFPLWQTGDSVPLPWDRDKSIRDAVATLRLLPG